MSTAPCLRQQKESLSSKSKSVTYVTDVRLSNDVIPEHYDLELRPDFYTPPMENFRFDGHVSIRVLCQKSTSLVRLHIHQLNISSVRVTDENGLSQLLKPNGIIEDKLRQFLVISLQSPLQANQRYWIRIEFAGPLRDDLSGLYVSSYERQNETMLVL